MFSSQVVLRFKSMVERISVQTIKYLHMNAAVSVRYRLYGIARTPSVPKSFAMEVKRATFKGGTESVVIMNDVPKSKAKKLPPHNVLNSGL